MARITPYTSPSPKLDSTPALCTIASGQIWRTMPAMNVPCPASKSRIGRPSSLVSSSSSTRPSCGDISHLAPGRVRQSVRATVLGPPQRSGPFRGAGHQLGAQAGVEHEHARRHLAGDGERRAQRHGGRRRRHCGRQDHRLAVNGLVGDRADEGHVARPRGGDAERAAGDRLRADDDVVVLGVELGFAQQLEQVGGVADLAAPSSPAPSSVPVTDRRWRRTTGRVTMASSSSANSARAPGTSLGSVADRRLRVSPFGASTTTELGRSSNAWPACR